jgi:hypothetical protein
MKMEEPKPETRPLPAVWRVLRDSSAMISRAGGSQLMSFRAGDLITDPSIVRLLLLQRCDSLAPVPEAATFFYGAPEASSKSIHHLRFRRNTRLI